MVEDSSGRTFDLLPSGENWDSGWMVWGVRKAYQRRRTSSPPPLQERHPQTIAALIDSIPTVPRQVTAACPTEICTEFVQ